MVFIVIWVIFGIASAVVGSNKGRSGCGWFCLGILLGPLGLILALVVSSDAYALEQEKVRSGEMKICPYCAELVKREAIKCLHCGSDISETTTKPKRQATLEEPRQYTEEERAKIRRQNNIVVGSLMAFLVFMVGFWTVAKYLGK